MKSVIRYQQSAPDHRSGATTNQIVLFEFDRHQGRIDCAPCDGPVLRSIHMNTQPIESGFAHDGRHGSKCVRFRLVGAREIARGLIPGLFPGYPARSATGEFFELRVPTHLSDRLDVTVMQSEPSSVICCSLFASPGDKPQLDRFLCGHDEREWFIAAVPGGASSGSSGHGCA